MTTLANRSWIARIREFMYTPSYIFLIGLLTVISNVLNAELLVYTCFVLLGIFMCFFGRDFLPLMPIVICCYIAPSVSNNPGKNEHSIFSPGHGGLYLLAIALILVCCIVWRLVKDPQLGGRRFLRCRRYLLPGLLALGAAYLLAGLGSPYFFDYGFRNLLFGLMQFVAIFGMYFLLTGGVQWNKSPRYYLSWVGIGVGYVLVAELINIYIVNDVIVNGVIIRERIFTGWGHYNNIGVLLSMAIPFAFSMACKGRHTGKYYITGLVFLLAILFSCSRNSIIFGFITYLTSYVMTIFYTRHRRASIVIHVATALGFALFFLIFQPQLKQLFDNLMDVGLDPSDRYNVYKSGILQFLDDPLFGGTFFPAHYPRPNWSTSEAFLTFFPARWHNTFIQILASCGLAGFIAYCYHRFQTIRLFLKRISPLKILVGFSVLALLATSMLDCHLFNIGPALFYSMILAFTEKRLTVKM